MDDWGDLKEWALEECESAVLEEQKHLSNTFMEYITTPVWEGGRTPVDSGKLMANTIVSIGYVDNNTIEAEDQSGTDTLTKAQLKVGSAPAFSKIYIQNNAKDGTDYYALNADYKGWARTPAYRFFTLAWETTRADAEERNR